MRTIILCATLVAVGCNANAQLGSGWDWASISTAANYSPGRAVLDIAVDAQGNSYATGRFQGSMTLGGETVSTSGDGSVNFNFDEDAYVVKYNSAGEVQWLKEYGVNATGSNQIGQSIAVDASGNVYVGGSGLTGQTTNNAFLLKYGPAGNLLWSKTDFPLYEINGINIAPDGNLVVQESNGAAKNIYKINPEDASVIWTTSNTGAGSNSTTTFQDFVDSEGNIYYTCFSGGGTVVIAGQSFSIANLTTFIASLDSNGARRWVQPIDNVQVQLSYTIDSAGKSYIQIGGGFGGMFQGVSTGTGGGSRYLELDNNGNLTRNLFQSPYRGLFRVKDDAIYGFIFEGGGFPGTVTYGDYSYQLPTDNTKGLAAVIRYDRTTDAVTWANTFLLWGASFNPGKFYTIETGNNKIFVGGMEGNGVIFGGTTLSVVSSSGNFPSDLFIAQGSLPSLGGDQFSRRGMTVYPNPAGNLLSFDTDKTLMAKIFSLSGQLLLEQEIGENLNSIDVSGITSGIYIAETTDAAGMSQKTKFVKK